MNEHGPCLGVKPLTPLPMHRYFKDLQPQELQSAAKNDYPAPASDGLQGLKPLETRRSAPETGDSGDESGIHCRMRQEKLSALRDNTVSIRSWMTGPTMEQSFLEAEDVDIDPNYNRSKRRRTATEDDVAATRNPIPKDESSENKNTAPTALLPTPTDLHMQKAGSLKPASSNGNGSCGGALDVTAHDACQPQDRVALPASEHVCNDTSTSAHAISNSQQEPTRQLRQTSISHNYGLLSKQETSHVHAAGARTTHQRTSPRNKKHINITSHCPTVPKRGTKMKNGKFVQTLVVVVRYDKGHESNNVGVRIDQILSSTRDGTATKQARNGQAHHLETKGHSNKQSVVDWKDIKFSKTRSSLYQPNDLLPPIWPPRDFAHVFGHTKAEPQVVPDIQFASTAKLKSSSVEIKEAESVLHSFTSDLLRAKQKPIKSEVTVPERRYLTGQEVFTRLESIASAPLPSSLALRLSADIVDGSTAFDKGEAAGQLSWPQKYAPVSSNQVLQPSCGVLHEWLKNLAVHHVKKGLDTEVTIAKSRQFKKKTKRAKDELDDFIVDSDSEEKSAGDAASNAILIVGPHGCGKTASVYATCRELGFEVFEIHSGLKRSAKDIFEKVGSMTRNHLVQGGEGNKNLSRSSSIAPSDGETPAAESRDKLQLSLGKFAKHGNAVGAHGPLPNNITALAAKKEQKQSVVLFEEVDILFEEDKGFWTGVQSLIQQSRRPVILTCNDPSSIPLDELDLYAILTYTSPDLLLATNYLTLVAAAEGHLLERDAISELYLSKGGDIRASLTELNFWCQMTVGSRQGGLDWMRTHRLTSLKDASTHQSEALRTFSENTYFLGLNLVPQVQSDVGSQLLGYQQSLGVPACEWVEHCGDQLSAAPQCYTSNVAQLEFIASSFEFRSAVDIIDTNNTPWLASHLIETSQSGAQHLDRSVVTTTYSRMKTKRVSRLPDLWASLEPLCQEKPTFPPAQGRLAPSLDMPSPMLATDIAPYVRSIVSFDRSQEHQREEVSGLQGSQGRKVRTTRAARAAEEGGDKAHTRTERWFPKDLDFIEVLGTAGHAWPNFPAAAHEIIGGGPSTESPSLELSKSLPI